MLNPQWLKAAMHSLGNQATSRHAWIPSLPRTFSRARCVCHLPGSRSTAAPAAAAPGAAAPLAAAPACAPAAAAAVLVAGSCCRRSSGRLGGRQGLALLLLSNERNSRRQRHWVAICCCSRRLGIHAQVKVVALHSGRQRLVANARIPKQ